MCGSTWKATRIEMGCPETRSIGCASSAFINLHHPVRQPNWPQTITETSPTKTTFRRRAGVISAKSQLVTRITAATVSDEFWVGMVGGYATSTELLQRFSSPRPLKELVVTADCYADGKNLGGQSHVAGCPSRSQAQLARRHAGSTPRPSASYRSDQRTRRLAGIRRARRTTKQQRRRTRHQSLCNAARTESGRKVMSA